MAPNVSPQTRLKVSLKMTISKLRFTQEKKTALCKQQRRQLADLLRVGKEESAKIRVENIIREDIYIELLEILELYCELLLARIGLLDVGTPPPSGNGNGKSAGCDPGLEEAVKVIIYATPHTEIKELAGVRDMLVHRFGKEFAQLALSNQDEIIPKKVSDRVASRAPSPELVSLYLKEIARAYEVPFSEMSDNEDELDQLEQEALSEESDDGSSSRSNSSSRSGGGGGAHNAAIEVVDDVDVDDVELPEKKFPDVNVKGKKDGNAPIKVTAPGRSSENVHPRVKVPKDMGKEVKHALRKGSGGDGGSGSGSGSTDLEALRKRFAALKRG